MFKIDYFHLYIHFLCVFTTIITSTEKPSRRRRISTNMTKLGRGKVNPWCLRRPKRDVPKERSIFVPSLIYAWDSNCELGLVPYSI